MKTFLVGFFLLILAACGNSPKAAPQTTTTPIAKSWNISLSGSNPEGWSFTPSVINMASLPVGTCMTDFQNAGVAGLPATFGSCSFANNMPAGIQDVFFATDTTQLYAGEKVYFWLQYSDGTNTAVLEGQTTFANNTISGQLDCLQLNGGSCTWSVQLTAK